MTAITEECCEQYWTNPWGNTWQSSSCTVNYHPSRQPSKLDKPDKRGTAGEVRMNSWAIYSCGPLHLDEQRRDDQLKPIYNNSIQDVALKTFWERSTIESVGLRGSGRSVLAAWHDDDDDDDEFSHIFTSACSSIYVYIYVKLFSESPWSNHLDVWFWHRSKQVRSPVTLLRSLSDKKPWERYEPLILSATVYLQGWTCINNSQKERLFICFFIYVILFICLPCSTCYLTKISIDVSFRFRPFIFLSLFILMWLSGH